MVFQPYCQWLQPCPVSDCGERHYQPITKLDADDIARKPLKPLLGIGAIVHYTKRLIFS
jgi:hypothetical protein